jgi:hypothetical protein
VLIDGDKHRCSDSAGGRWIKPYTVDVNDALALRPSKNHFVGGWGSSQDTSAVKKYRNSSGSDSSMLTVQRNVLPSIK